MDYIFYKDWWIFRDKLNGSECYYIDFEGEETYFASVAEAIEFINGIEY